MKQIASLRDCFEKAWNDRANLGLLDRLNAVRVFHGPGDGDQSELQGFAVDRFLDHYWVTQWEGTQGLRDELVHYFRSRGALSIVGLVRPERGVAPESQTWWGRTPKERFVVEEKACKFWIQLEKTRHPGLFLDHQPLRQWLVESAQGWNVLNTFAYTGSLSVAAAVGKAKAVTTLDLSQPTIQWAKENMELNGFTSQDNRFIAGDVFEWLPRLKRERQVFDCVILDPPSFSHGKKGRFSTAKDLESLHGLAMDVLAPGGVLITSINSSNISWKKYEGDVASAAKGKKMNFQVLKQIDLPETFPTLFGSPDDRYLKGWILKRMI